MDIYIKQLIRSYELNQDLSINHQNSLLKSLKRMNKEYGEAWQDIMNYWRYINTNFQVNYIKKEDSKIVVPKDLGVVPDDDSLVIVILGIKLNNDGTMNDELIGRLETGLALSNRYPKAFLLVSGGPTAKDNKEVTEGEQMAEWLMNHGLKKHRLIVENRALDTIGNAIYTYDLLSESYPQVNSILVVSSDYHVSRGCLLYYSTLRLAALKKKGKQLSVVSNAGFYTASQGYETIALQAWSICQVAGIDYWRLPVEFD